MPSSANSSSTNSSSTISSSTISSRLLSCSLVLVCAALFSHAAEAKTVVKMATLVPEGSVWDEALRDMGAAWTKNTGGEVELRLYPGGVAGDEPDIVRKMRVGQLHAAALTVAGLSTIDSSFEIFEVPMFFASYDELNYVLDTLKPEFAKRLEARGYRLLNWGCGGWVHLFSKKPIATVDDLRQQKIFSWAGNEAMIELWRKNNFQAVSLAATDILTSLQTGMVEVVPTTPLAALSLQWFRQTPNMQDLGLAPLVGATVISDRIWKKLDAKEQSAMLAAGLDTERRLREEIPKQDAKAVEEMKKRGLNVVAVPAGGLEGWNQVADIFADFRQQNIEDKAWFMRVHEVRDAYRAEHAKTAK